MGRDKLLLPWGDTVVIGSLLAALSDGGVDETVVVVPPDNPELAGWLRDAGVRVCGPRSRRPHHRGVYHLFHRREHAHHGAHVRVHARGDARRVRR